VLRAYVGHVNLVAADADRRVRPDARTVESALTRGPGRGGRTVGRYVETLREGLRRPLRGRAALQRLLRNSWRTRRSTVFPIPLSFSLTVR